MDEFWDQANDDQYFYVRLFTLIIFLVCYSSVVSRIQLLKGAKSGGHSWHWSSWITGASLGLYVFLYSLAYLLASEMSGFPQYFFYTLASGTFAAALALVPFDL